jgi:hypothetical protein
MQEQHQAPAAIAGRDCWWLLPSCAAWLSYVLCYKSQDFTGSWGCPWCTDHGRLNSAHTTHAARLLLLPLAPAGVQGRGEHHAAAWL